MDTTQEFTPSMEAISKTAALLEKLHNCADCPIRRQAMRQPQSIFARIHRWHITWWPGWKAYQARACALRTRA